MSKNDEVKPFHAKGVGAGQETADVVAAVIKHAAARDKAAKNRTVPRKQPKWLLPVGVNLAVFAAYLLVSSPEWVVLNPIAPPPTQVQVEKLSGAMWLAINKIEGFNLNNDRLPRSLTEAGASEAGLTYTLGSSYVLSAEAGEEALVFNSAAQTAREWGLANAAGLAVRIGG